MFARDAVEVARRCLCLELLLQRLGLETVWVNRKREARAPDDPVPGAVIGGLDELVDAIGRLGSRAPTDAGGDRR